MSKRKKIAPKIAEWLDACDRHELGWHVPLKTEFRALLAVARAARDIEDCVRACWIDSAQNLRATRAVSRALARLDRVSEEP